MNRPGAVIVFQLNDRRRSVVPAAARSCSLAMYNARRRRRRSRLSAESDRRGVGLAGEYVCGAGTRSQRVDWYVVGGSDHGRVAVDRDRLAEPVAGVSVLRGSLAVSVWLPPHPVFGWTNTYASPWASALPTVCEAELETIVSPEIASAKPPSSSPNTSPFSTLPKPSEAVSVPVWVRVPVQQRRQLVE